MRKEYGKALRSMFAAEMKLRFPAFREEKVRSMYFMPGDRGYCRPVTGRLHCWIVLHPSKKDYDEFTLLVGWSRLGRYPELGMVPCADMPTDEGREFAHDEYLTRLPSLWTRKDAWWVVKPFKAALTVEEMQAAMAPIPADEAREAVNPHVQDAMDKLAEYGMPWLERMCRDSGVQM